MAGRDATSTAASVRWGIPDAPLSYLAGLIAAIVLANLAAGVTGATEGDENTAVTAASFLGQFAGVVLAMIAVSRLKGRHSLVRDFGLRIRVSDWWLVPAGALLEIACAIALVPLSEMISGESQEVVEQLQDASGAKLAVFVVVAGFVAPFVEELLFRGLLLRALMRRMTATGAVMVSAIAFALLHLLDPSLGTVVALPALTAVGVVSGVLAVRTGDLSRSILLHVGFNLVTVVGQLASR
jgi:membrane protease YdiL (CAAX protease family)